MIQTLLLILFSATGLSAAADSPALPRSYVTSVGKDHVFVMLSNEGGPGAEQRSSSGELYPASGLYKNDGSVSPEWTVDWYADQIQITKDGRYLIRHGEWTGRKAALGIAFYDRGVLMKEYRVNDLVFDFSKVTHTVSHFFWQSHTSLDEQSLSYRLETKSDNNYIFDITTGDVLERSGPQPRPYIAELMFRNGEHDEWRNFRICNHKYYEAAVSNLGRDAERTFFNVRFNGLNGNKERWYAEFGEVGSAEALPMEASDKSLRWSAEPVNGNRTHEWEV